MSLRCHACGDTLLTRQSMVVAGGGTLLCCETMAWVACYHDAKHAGCVESEPYPQQPAVSRGYAPGGFVGSNLLHLWHQPEEFVHICTGLSCALIICGTGLRSDVLRNFSHVLPLASNEVMF